MSAIKALNGSIKASLLPTLGAERRLVGTDLARSEIEHVKTIGLPDRYHDRQQPEVPVLSHLGALRSQSPSYSRGAATTVQNAPNRAYVCLDLVVDRVRKPSGKHPMKSPRSARGYRHTAPANQYQ